MNAYLILEDGTVWKGVSIGAATERFCEIAFHTAMSGHTEIITSPVCAGKGICFSYPLIGNCGVCYEDFESDRPQVSGLILSECSEIPSNFRAEDSLPAVLKRYNIPAVSGIDTRFLVRLLREKGVVRALLTTSSVRVDNLEDTCREIARWKAVPFTSERAGKSFGEEKGKRVALLDTGAKNSLIEQLTRRGLRVTAYAADTKAERILADNPQGIILPPGSGNPNDFAFLIQIAKAFYDTDLPLMALGLGHQLLALATGAEVNPLPHGHWGLNYPVRCLDTGKVFITAQNHSYSVCEKSLHTDTCRVSHRNVNDGSAEGLSYRRPNTVSLQFVPDAYGTESIFDAFTAGIGG